MTILIAFGLAMTQTEIREFYPAVLWAAPLALFVIALEFQKRCRARMLAR